MRGNNLGKDKIRKNGLCENNAAVSGEIGLSSCIAELKKPVHKKNIIEEFMSTHLIGPMESTIKTYRCVLCDFLNFILSNGKIIESTNGKAIYSYINSKANRWRFCFFYFKEGWN